MNFSIAIVLSSLISYFLAKSFIPYLTKLKFGQVIREEGPKSHHQKSGTPTMGGLIFIFSSLISVTLLYFFGLLEFSYELFIILITFIGFGLVGFLDDYLKVVKKHNMGLRAYQKVLGQLIIAALFFLIYKANHGSTQLMITSLNISLELSYFYYVLIAVFLIGFSNAVNLTDGLDGLATGLSIIAFLTFGILALFKDGSNYHNIAIFCFVLSAALGVFLIFNIHPAKVFMGDIGSLTLGGTLAAVAILLHYEVTLVVVAGVFILETLSVILQVSAFKIVKKRIFLMSPLHHHFELMKWTEKEIVITFWLTGAFFAVLALIYGVVL